MKTIYLTISLFICFSGAGYAQQQDSKVIKQTVEKNRNVNTKVAYNRFLRDMVNSVDDVYAEYEDLIQRVWDEESSMNLTGSSAAPVKKIKDYQKKIIDKRIYRGGENYQKAVLDYMDAVKAKIELLEKYGILGADANSDFDAYKRSAIAFDEATNAAIEKRNAIRSEKGIYEKTYYIE